MSEIPRDIRLASEECVIYLPLSGRWREILCGVIAKAIWEERQRCAKIAESAKSKVYMNSDMMADHISQAILSDKEES